MHHVFDDQDGRELQGSYLPIDATRLMEAASAVVVWMASRGWLTKAHRLDEILDVFQAGEASSDLVCARIGHRRIGDI